MGDENDSGYNPSGTDSNDFKLDPFTHSAGFDDISNTNDKYNDDTLPFGARHYVETDVDEIIADNETHPDGAVPRFILSSLNQGEKPQLNGDGPSLNLIGKEGSEYLNGHEQRGADESCGQDCVYYTLLCCECSIL